MTWTDVSLTCPGQIYNLPREDPQDLANCSHPAPCGLPTLQRRAPWRPDLLQRGGLVSGDKPAHDDVLEQDHLEGGQDGAAVQH